MYLTVIFTVSCCYIITGTDFLKSPVEFSLEANDRLYSSHLE